MSITRSPRAAVAGSSGKVSTTSSLTSAAMLEKRPTSDGEWANFRRSRAAVTTWSRRSGIATLACANTVVSRSGKPTPSSAKLSVRVVSCTAWSDVAVSARADVRTAYGSAAGLAVSTLAGSAAAALSAARASPLPLPNSSAASSRAAAGPSPVRAGPLRLLPTAFAACRPTQRQNFAEPAREIRKIISIAFSGLS